MAVIIEGYHWDDFDTGKSMVAVSIANDAGMAFSVDLTRKQAKKLITEVKRSLKEGK